MLKRKECHGDMADIHVYTAKKLEGMADSLENLARTFDGDGQMGQNLSREDGLAALQMASAMVCGDCAKCNLYSDSQREDSYYLYYLPAPLSRMEAWDRRTCPGFSRRPAGNRPIMWDS